MGDNGSAGSLYGFSIDVNVLEFFLLELELLSDFK